MIRFQAVTKFHKGKHAPAVTQLDLHVREGELCVFVGPSGCGKSTILRMTNRLDIPDSGVISVAGVATDAIDVIALRRGIGFMMQNAALFPHITVEANIGAVPRLLKWSRAKTHARVLELMSLVGLDIDLLGRYPSQLSGGQQSRVALARALASDPPVILMDEPFSALDPVTRERLQDELIALHKRLKKTIVLVTHDMDEAIKLGDRIAVFEEEGRLVQFDTPVQILANPETPFVRQFVGSNSALKRLALIKIDQLQAAKAPANGHDDLTFNSREGSPAKLILNEQAKPVHWQADSPLSASALALVTAQDSLNQALLSILSSPLGIAVQVDEQGRYSRCISIQDLYEALHEEREGLS
jgi:osmoprotectant transport system ATP-binding protein